MRAPKVFISHSSKNNATNLAFLDKVRDALKTDENGNNFDVLVDRDLQAGDKWHKKISEWMHECDAAVLLLTPDALKSNWVQQESTVVAVRDRNEPDFKLIPVLLQDVTAECVTNHSFLGSGSAAQLNDSQFICNCPNEANIITSIVTALGELQAKTTPFDRIERVISRILNEVDQETLEEAWQSLGGENKPTWKQDGTPFSDALVRYLFRHQEGCVQSFEELVNNIRPKLHPKRAKELLNYIRPLWVNPVAVACLPATAQQQNKMAVMNGKMLQDFTFPRYIERAWPLNDKIKQVNISRTDDVDVIQQLMRDHINHKYPQSLQLKPDECDEKIIKSDLPILVYLPATEAEGGLLDPRMRMELTKKYPNVIFVMDVGETLSENYPKDVLGIRPELDIENERKQRFAELDAEEFLTKYCA